MNHRLFQQAEQYIDTNYDRYLSELLQLAAIPSPSGDEGRRAEWIKNYLESFGAKGVYIDQALNVIYPYHAQNCKELVVFLAHSDTVFPDTTPINITMDDQKIYGPGIGDNTTSLTCMLEMARFFTENSILPSTGFLFVANSCEEGLGNLKGTRQIMEDFAGRIKEVVAIDGSSFGVFVNDAVGSKRYKVEVKTEGGHSYGAFGNRNAIYYMSQIIASLYAMKVPAMGKTTYNVGKIAGGTSVNTIAQQCEMLYEFRSDKREALALMDDMFQSVIAAYAKMGIAVAIELVGDRPCKGDVDLEELTQRVTKVGAKFGWKMEPRASSTDCNIPLSMGIPSICISVYQGQKAHTREEFVIKDSMRTGMRYLAAFLLSYVE